MKIKKDLFQVFLANVINLIISIGNTLLLPKILPILSYADIKTYTLYSSYVSLLHFGFIDGIYICYGGKENKDLSKYELTISYKAFLLFQIIISSVTLIIALYIGDWCFILASLSILPINMRTLFVYFFQSLGEFRKYRLVLNFTTVGTFILNLFLLFVLHSIDAFHYIGVQISMMIISWLSFTFYMRGYYEKVKTDLSTYLHTIIKYIRNGWIVLIGNTMTTWVVGIDRWFTKFLCSSEDFAYYSFGASMLNLINALTSAFSITFYRYFCRNNSKEYVKRIRRYMIIIGSAFICLSKPIGEIITLLLPKYYQSIKVSYVLIGAQLFTIIINSIYTNLFKALNKQKEYLITMGVSTCIAIILNALAFGVIKDDILGFAVATFFTTMIWLIICQFLMPAYKMEIDEWLYVAIALTMYFFIYQYGFYSMALYLLFVMITSLIIFKGEFVSLIKLLIERGIKWRE